jgi:IS5 family transposase
VTVTHELLHGKEDCVLSDSGYTGADKRAELEGCKATFFIADKRSNVKAIKNKRDRRQYERWESCKASMRAKVEHPFRSRSCVFKHQRNQLDHQPSDTCFR